jgi:hypothetical protein
MGVAVLGPPAVGPVRPCARGSGSTSAVVQVQVRGGAIARVPAAPG